MIWHSLEAVRSASDEFPVVVVGHGAEGVREEVGEAARFVVQEKQLGTGHAALQTRDLLRGKSDFILVGQADMPLIRAESYQKLVKTQEQNSGPMSLMTVIAQEPRGFGRIIREAQGHVKAIVEDAQATPEQLAIRELNVGAYCFRASWLWEALERISLSPKGEYYLTDLLGLAVEEGLEVKAEVIDDPAEAIGINSRVHLAEAEAALRKRINESWMLAGVTLLDPQTTYIQPNVTIGQDTVIWPNTILEGDTHIGERCSIGPNTLINNTKIGNRCEITASVLEGAVVEDEVDIGPFAHLRKGAHLASGAHMGNFGEVKNSYLGPGVKMGHFSYVGDATIGENVNIGAGTVTCNFDGERKQHTEIEAGAFIGSDTMLVAPLKIGKGARTGAGSVVTKDVPPDTTVVGMPARAIRKASKRD